VGGGLQVTSTPKTGVTIQRVSQGGRIMAVRSYGAKSNHPTAPTWDPLNENKRPSLAVGYAPLPSTKTPRGRVVPSPQPVVGPSE